MSSRRNKSRRRTKPANSEAVTEPSPDATQSDSGKDQSPVAAKTTAESAGEPHSERVVKTLAKVEELLSQTNDSPSSSPLDSSDWSQLLEQSLEKTHDRIANQLSEFAESFDDKLEKLRQIVSAGENNGTAKQPTSDSSKDPAGDWEGRKRELYLEIGEDLTAELDEKTSAKNGRDELASLQESLHDSIESLDEVEAEEIDDLRAKLTEKLREAEVELSINRAKLDQRRAELDRRHTELDRREKSLESKYVSINGKTQKAGVLDRLTRHLGVRKQSDSL